MCGITGAVALHPAGKWSREHLGRQVLAMSDAIAHRGPDDSGVWVETEGRVAFGHRRLAIVDLSERGHQPMSYGGRYVIAFNGEIYNFRELRRDLIAAGHQFNSSTDTEVIMGCVQEYGIERALRLMVGMFAFALWDAKERALYLARDRMGEKPLYLGVHEGYLVFGSELHALQAVPGLCEDLSALAVASYLTHGYVQAPASMWCGVGKLPQATYLRVVADAETGLSIDRESGHLLQRAGPGPRVYWEVPSSGRKEWQPREAVDQLQSLLEESIRGQMHCDVPTGVFLSGGIDSTVVAAITQQLAPTPISTFTVKFAVPGFDESVHASAVARHLGTSHHEIALDPGELVRAIPTLASTLDEPTANASFFPLEMMARAARQHVKVVLSGDAGDEIFGGYNRYRLTPRLWRIFGWLPPVLRRLLANAFAAIPAATISRSAAYMGLSGQASTAATLKKLARFLDAPTIGQGYRRLMHCWDNSALIADVANPVESAFDCDLSSFLAMATAQDMRSYLPDDNLAKADRATMAAGLEQRVPFLDVRIVEFARTLPDSFLINEGVTKWLLRQVAYRHVPREIMDRPKMGFTVPIDAWLRGPLREWAGDLLHTSSLLQKGFLKPEAVKRCWHQFQRFDAPLAWELWSLVVYSAWLGARFEPNIVLQRRHA